MYNPIRLIRKFIPRIERRRWNTVNRNAKEAKEHKPLKRIRGCRVAIVGIGGVGKSLAHLLKMCPSGLTELRLCNRSDPGGIVEELNHIPTKLPIQGFKGVERFPLGLRDADIVVLTAGIPRKPGMERRQLFTDNATIVRDVMNICADVCPDALIAIVTNPLDSLVPLAAAILKKRGVYRPEKLFGICQIDQMRAQRFYAEAIGQEPRKTYVPVVGGHAEVTTVPLFSKAKPSVSLSEEEINTLIELVKGAGRKVVLAKKGKGGATFSMATATLYFVHKLCYSIYQEPHVILSAYVESKVTKAPFFCNELLLGPRGVHKNLGYGTVTKFEEALINEAVTILQRDVEMAEEFVAKNGK